MLNLDYLNGITVKSVSLVETENGNQIEVIKREPSNSMYACNPPRPVPDTVWKEVYGIVDGKIQLIDTIQGKHIPAEAIHKPEEFIFEESK